jgi:glucose 1-dehydrogenase
VDKANQGGDMSEQKSLRGQTALVTGSSSGIGAGIALAMAAAGANLVVNYASNADAAERVVKEIGDRGGKAIAVRADVSDEQQVLALFKATFEAYGTIDILVSNAGVQQDAAFAEMTLQQWQTVIGINLTGAFLCARQAAKEFLRRGVIPERSRAAGKIIFISSVHEVIPWSRHANYAASKGGIMLLMKSVAQELGPHKIRVNSIGPGAIKTNINKRAWKTPEAETALRKLIPYGRIGQAGDIGSIAAWLASDEADYITGTTIYADGGMLLYPGFATGG